MTRDASIPQSDKQIWIEKLERAAEKGIIHSATGTWVKLRRWSPRRYHSTMDAAMVKGITRIVKLKTRRHDERNSAASATNRRKDDALENAYFKGSAAI